MDNVVPFAFEPLMTENELVECESVIEKGLQTYVTVGRALADIRDKKGYRFSHGTFAEYVEDRWKMSIRSAYENITASQLSENVRTGAQIGMKQAVAIGKLPSEQQQAFVGAHDIENMSVRQTNEAVKEWEMRLRESEKRAEKLAKDLKEAREFADLQQQRANDFFHANEQLKRQKNPEPQIVEVEKVVPPSDYQEVLVKNQEMNTKIARLSGDMDSIRRDYEKRLRDVQDGDVKANSRELNRLLSEQLKALNWNHSSALFVFQRLTGNADAVRSVREFMNEYQEAVRRQLNDWQNAITLQTKEEETWETI